MSLDEAVPGLAHTGNSRAVQAGTWSSLHAMLQGMGSCSSTAHVLSGAWQEQARCRGVDPRVFYPERGGSASPARRLCSSCGVRLECLEYALLMNERFGIWGGMSEQERRALRARLARWGGAG